MSFKIKFTKISQNTDSRQIRMGAKIELVPNLGLFTARYDN